MHHFRRSWIWIFAALAALPSMGLAEDKPLVGKDLLFWRANYPRITKYYVPVSNEFYACISWHTGYPSSAHVTVNGWIKKNTKVGKKQVGTNVSKKVFLRPSKEEGVAAAATLPKLSPGLYGHIHSAKIEKVVGPNRMIINSIRYVDQVKTFELKNAESKKLDKYIWDENEKLRAINQKNRKQSRRKNIQKINRVDEAGLRKALDDRYKERELRIKDQNDLRSVRVLVLGFPTGGVVKGTRWKGDGLAAHGPQIAVVGVAQEKGYNASTASGRRKQVFVAVNTDLFKRNRIDEESFKRLLKQRGLTPAEFVVFAQKVIADVRMKARDKEQTGYIKYDANNPHPHVCLALEALDRDKDADAGGPVAETPASTEPKKPTDAAGWFDKNKKPGTTTATTKPADPAAKDDPDSKEAASTPAAGSGGLGWFKKKGAPSGSK
jgi:hypothetical protein